MKTLIMSILVVLMVSCKKEDIQPESKGTNLAIEIKTWYRYDASQLMIWDFNNDSILQINRIDYKNVSKITPELLSQMAEYVKYVITQDSLLLNYNHLIERYAYKINSDSLTTYKNGYKSSVYYSHKK